jgi:MYXO-CTERM domain-containing protein
MRRMLCVIGVCGMAATASADTLLDQPPDPGLFLGNANQEFSDFPDFSTYAVNDVSFVIGVTLETITTYHRNFNDTWPGVGTGTAILNIFDKVGARPDDVTDDPTVGLIVPVQFVESATGVDVIAGGLSIDLPAGDYWIGLTPQLDAIFPGQENVLLAGTLIGDETAQNNPGGAFGFAPGWSGVGDSIGGVPVDYAMTIEGTPIPAPGALAVVGVAGVCAGRRRR